MRTIEEVIPTLKTFLIDQGLSEFQVIVASLVSKGLSNKEIANQLFLTEKGIKMRISNIYPKLGVKSRAQLIVLCLPYMGF